jgi:hypothetical protein
MKKVLILIILLSGVAFVSLESCKKNSYTDATVVKDGDAAVDGCGWLLYIDGIYYYPTNLDSQYYSDGMVISIQYTISALPFLCIDNESYPALTIARYN